jgi:hypothetical protein
MLNSLAHFNYLIINFINCSIYCYFINHFMINPIHSIIPIITNHFHFVIYNLVNFLVLHYD